MKAIRLKVKREAYPWLSAAAVEVNQVWNFSNEQSSTVFGNLGKRLSGFDLCARTSGTSQYMRRIHSQVVQRVCNEYAAKRMAAKKNRLRWRVSSGARRSLGWVPFRASDLKRSGNALRFAGKTFRVFEHELLSDVKWKQGCFAQDSVGDWWLCLPVDVAVEQSIAPLEAVGIDLGLKSVATTSDGDILAAGRWTNANADRLANAQRRGHLRQAKRINRKTARCRADALHKFSRKIVDQYQKIVIGDVSSSSLAKTRMAKSVLDSGWGILKAQLQYKGEHAGRSVSVVNERYTTAACSSCGSLSGPRGVNDLAVRAWTCCDCGESHDRDVNAARNILARAEASASVCGNEVKTMNAGPPRC